MDFPFIATGKRFDGDKLFTLFNDVLPYIYFADDLTGSTIVNGRFEGKGFVYQGAKNTLMVTAVIIFGISDLR